MNILRKVSEIPSLTNPVVTIGTFDGIHLGHQQIFQHLFEIKKSYNGVSFLITFEPHPQLVLKSKSTPIKLITSLDEKLEIISKFNIDYVLVLNFTSKLSKMSGESFIEEILIKKLGIVDIVIGYDHAFGYNRSGNINTIREYSAKNNFRVNVIKPFLHHKEIVKSSAIRQSIKQGDVQRVKQFLGRPYQIKGQVVRGKGRGKRLNFPTANLQPLDLNKLWPGDGIYATQLELKNRSYNGAVSIGTRPTFNEHVRTIETNIFDFDEDVYGENMTIKFIQKLRDEEKFDSAEGLISQMHLDVDLAKKILNS